jgi:hypothetical protein
MSSQHCSRAIGGWLAGCGAATAVLGVFVLFVMVVASGGDLPRLAGTVLAAIFPLLLTFLVICVVTSFPAAIVVWISERLQISAIAFFGCAGAIIGGVSVELLWRSFVLQAPPVPVGVHLLFAIAGLAAGLVYWHKAGKFAGRDRVSAGCPRIIERFNWRSR